MDRRLLVPDDEPDVCDLIADIAAENGYSCRQANDIESFWLAYDEFDPTMVVLDLALKGEDGIHVLRALSERGATALDDKLVQSLLRDIERPTGDTP